MTNLLNNAQECIKKSCRYITSAQNTDGYWEDFFIRGMGFSSQWITSYIAFQLLKASQCGKEIKKAIQWLRVTESKNGGWGYKKDCIPDADSTLNALRLIIKSQKRPDFRENPSRLLNIIAAFIDRKTGGIITYPNIPGTAHMHHASAWCMPEVSISALAGIVLSDTDPVFFENHIIEIKNFLIKQQRPDGYWDSYWWDCRIYSTCMVCEFLITIGEVNPVQKALMWLLKIYNQRLRGWGNGYEDNTYPFYTALVVSALLKSDLCKHEYLQFAVKSLVNSQNMDGSWMCKPMLRIPNPTVGDPWLEPYRSQCELATEPNLLFTTSTVTGALLQFIHAN